LQKYKIFRIWLEMKGKNNMRMNISYV